MRERHINADQTAMKVALIGNPNVGKSTLFNGLTGMHQHTGNWPGKTVGSAVGKTIWQGREILLVDLPGTYSLSAHSAEEEITRDFLLFEEPDAAVVVCDATCIARNLSLVLQVIEVCPRTAICVNLMKEAASKGISVDLRALSHALSVPVVGVEARRKRTLSGLLATLVGLEKREPVPLQITYHPALEGAIEVLQPAVEETTHLPTRFVALSLLDADPALGVLLGPCYSSKERLAEAKEILQKENLTDEALQDSIAASRHARSEEILALAVKKVGDPHRRDRRIDRILTGRFTAFPFMLLLLALVFWITAVGANYPSDLLSRVFSWMGSWLERLLTVLCLPAPWISFLVDGVFGILSSVVAVMLPPMAIFFPLFTLLEDAGYLPRVAYNLDRPFARCGACGKQALCMCMGFGCNAVGVTGCRIIDSRRERLLALLTNVFVPCNGRFPAMLTLLCIFFGHFGGFVPALLLTLLVLVGIGMTFLVTALLSRTLFRGIPSAFTLELPPYRPPQIGQILVRSVLDRTLFVLGRAAAVAAPAGALIWVLANVQIGEISLMAHIIACLDPVGRMMGLDGAILFGFLLGIPANEIVLPLTLMAYTATGVLPSLGSLSDISQVLITNGWTWVTAICFLLFSLMHWPCATTLVGIKKETGSLPLTVLAFLLPTFFGFLICLAVAGAARFFGF